MDWMTPMVGNEWDSNPNDDYDYDDNDFQTILF